MASTLSFNVILFFFINASKPTNNFVEESASLTLDKVCFPIGISVAEEHPNMTSQKETLKDSIAFLTNLHTDRYLNNRNHHSNYNYLGSCYHPHNCITDILG